MTVPADSPWRSLGRWFPGLFISLLAVLLLARLTAWGELRRALLLLDLRWLAPVLFFYLASLGLRALAWRTLLQGKVGSGRAFLALNEGYLLNNLFPFRLGELGRALLLGQASGLSPMFVLSTILIERAFDLAIAAGLLLATLPLVLGLESARPAALVALALVLLGLGALYLAARHRCRVRQLLDACFGGRRFVRRFLLPRLDASLEGLAALTRPGQFLLSAALLVASWSLGGIEIHLLLNSGSLQAPLWWTAFFLGVISLGVALPSAPASLGVYEAAAVGALSLLGVAAAPALAFALVAHLIHVSASGLIGAYALFRDGETLAGLYRRLRRLRSRHSCAS